MGVTPLVPPTEDKVTQGECWPHLSLSLQPPSRGWCQDCFSGENVWKVARGSSLQSLKSPFSRAR